MTEEEKNHVRTDNSAVIANMQKRIEQLEEALREIALAEGAYDTDRLKHASNTIDNMVRIAEEALTN